MPAHAACGRLAAYLRTGPLPFQLERLRSGAASRLPTGDVWGNSSFLAAVGFWPGLCYGISDDDIGAEGNALFAGSDDKRLANGKPSQVLIRDLNRGEFRAQVAGQFDVVKADDRKIFRHAQTLLLDGRHGAGRNDIGLAQDGRVVRLGSQPPDHALVPKLAAERAVFLQARVRRVPEVGKRASVAGQAHLGGGMTLRPGEEEYPGVPAREQMHRHGVGATLVVDIDHLDRDLTAMSAPMPGRPHRTGCEPAS